MRRMFVIIMMVVVLAFCLVGCTEDLVGEPDVEKETDLELDLDSKSDSKSKANSKQEELIDYFNNELQELAILESKMLTSYESVRGDNYVSDAVMYKELTTNTVILARELNDKAVKIAADIDDPKLLKAHQKYMEYTSKMMNAFTLMISAIENQDRFMITQANQVLTEANLAALDYKTELLNLVEEYNVKIED